MTDQPAASATAMSSSAKNTLILIKSTAMAFYGMATLWLMLVDAERASFGNLKGLITAAFAVLLFVELVLLWYPTSLAPTRWKESRSLRRTVVLTFPIVLASTCLLNLWGIHGLEAWKTWVIWHGPIAMIALTVKWWWDGDDGLLPSLALILLGLALALVALGHFNLLN